MNMNMSGDTKRLSIKHVERGEIAVAVATRI